MHLTELETFLRSYLTEELSDALVDIYSLMMRAGFIEIEDSLRIIKDRQDKDDTSVIVGNIIAVITDTIYSSSIRLGFRLYDTDVMTDFSRLIAVFTELINLPNYLNPESVAYLYEIDEDDTLSTICDIVVLNSEITEDIFLSTVESVTDSFEEGFATRIKEIREVIELDPMFDDLKDNSTKMITDRCLRFVRHYNSSLLKHMFTSGFRKVGGPDSFEFGLLSEYILTMVEQKNFGLEFFLYKLLTDESTESIITNFDKFISDTSVEDVKLGMAMSKWWNENKANVISILGNNDENY